MNSVRVNQLFRFIRERHAIYERRASGQPKPWTKDAVLQSYRFCNVYRELDTVTVWIRENWREPNSRDPLLWFAMAVARLVNWPDTLAAVGYPVPWNPTRFKSALEVRRLNREKVFTGAYMIHAENSSARKGDYLADSVLSPMWKRRKEVENYSTLEGLHNWLMTNKDFGSFMAGQVVADIKYQPRWLDADDWDTFAAQGPGSTRGLSRVEFGDANTKYNVVEWQESLKELRSLINPLVAKSGMTRIHAQDLQNCLCEFDKYERVRLGEGRPRSSYPGV